MPRRLRSPRVPELDLFPFLSILACTIGTLILLIIVITSQILSNERQVTIVARTENGENQGKQPRYLECRADGIILYPSQKLLAVSQLNNHNSPLRKLLDEIKNNRDQEYLIVAIRPDGIEVFKKIRALIEEAGIDLGYEPLDQGWELKLENLPASSK